MTGKKRPKSKVPFHSSRVNWTTNTCFLISQNLLYSKSMKSNSVINFWDTRWCKKKQYALSLQIWNEFHGLISSLILSSAYKFWNCNWHEIKQPIAIRFKSTDFDLVQADCCCSGATLFYKFLLYGLCRIARHSQFILSFVTQVLLRFSNRWKSFEVFHILSTTLNLLGCCSDTTKTCKRFSMLGSQITQNSVYILCY